jgi:hypothetical protein
MRSASDKGDKVMESVEPATRPAERERRPSHVADAPPASSALGQTTPEGGGGGSLGNSLPHNNHTRVFLHQLSQTLTSLHGTLELALLIDSDPQDYRRAIQQSLAQAKVLLQLFKSYRALTEEGNHRLPE